MTLDILMYGVMIVAVLTGLVTQALKNAFQRFEVDYSANSVAGWVSIMLSLALFVIYYVLADLTYSPELVIYVFVLAFLSWLSAMIGYDKVVQTIEQLRKVKL